MANPTSKDTQGKETVNSKYPTANPNSSFSASTSGAGQRPTNYAMERWLQESPREGPWSSAARLKSQAVGSNNAADVADQKPSSNQGSRAFQIQQGKLTFSASHAGLLICGIESGSSKK